MRKPSVILAGLSVLLLLLAGCGGGTNNVTVVGPDAAPVAIASPTASVSQTATVVVTVPASTLPASATQARTRITYTGGTQTSTMSAAGASTLQFSFSNVPVGATVVILVEALDASGTVLATATGSIVPTAAGPNSFPITAFIPPTSRFRAWAVGDGGRIVASEDGQTWVTQTSGTTADLGGVSFSDRANGWAVGAGGVVLHTTNGGDTWTPQTSGTAASLIRVSFVSPSTGWACGSGGVIIKTTDAGTTWTPQTSNTTRLLNRIQFLNFTTGWSSENATPNFSTPIFVVRTTNGGSTWTPGAVTQADNGTVISGLSFVSSTTGWVAGVRVVDDPMTMAPTPVAFISRTTDGAQSWTPLPTPPSIIGDMQFLDTTNGFAISTTNLLRTVNGGTGFTTAPVSPGPNLTSLSFLSTTQGLLVGNNGLILQTTDGAIFNVRASGVTEALRNVQLLP